MLVIALALHLAEVGLVGIGLIIIVTAFTGLTKEHDLGGAFTNAMPFAMLIVVFFAILGVAPEQHLVTPLADWVFTFDGDYHHLALYFTNGTLSLVSDNVFIATVFINEVENAYAAGIIAQMLQNINIEEVCANGNVAQTFAQYLASLPPGVLEDSDSGIREIVAQLGNRIETAYAKDTIETPFSAFISDVNATYAHKTFMTREEYDKLGVVVNMGTNIPAMATPNGHATLLFLLTSSLAPVLRLSYFRLVILTLPYTIAMTITGALAIYFFL
jgi:NhaB family Na+:H+ antiporter